MKRQYKKIDYKEIERLYPKLYKFHQESIKHKVVRVFPHEYIAIIDDEKRNINMLNVKDQTKYVLNNDTVNFLDIEFKGGTFAIVNENIIEIITTQDKRVLHPNKNYIFLKARFLSIPLSIPNDICLVTLSSSQSNVNYSKIDMFQLSTL